ncbi:MAG: disulfide bond formation protein B [Magnetospirillum sp.]|nr:MAG: disulfide bond formation protein B [Magnetospirillum sp.]
MKITTPILSVAVLTICVLALASALVAQYVFGLRPCILCLIQRGPFVLAALLAAVALRLPIHGRTLLQLAGLALLINGGVAVYHVGVEQHWWVSAVCPAGEVGGPVSVVDLMAEMNKPVEVHCDQPAWSFHGITMAALNIPFSALLGLMTLVLARREA